MSNTIVSEACVLCGQSAEWLPSDYDNSRDYRCTNSECGDYRIATASIKKTRGNKALQDAAKSAKASRKILIIHYDSDPEPVDPSSIDFFHA